MSSPRLKFNRSLEKFFGGSLVVGCGANPEFGAKMGELFGFEYHKLHNNKRQFYSVDLREDLQPDLACNVYFCPESFDKRFDFIWLEFLPYNVYLTESKNENHFDNKRIEEMMSDAAVLLITGGIPSSSKKQIQEQIYDFKTETAHDEVNIFVKGPKNVNPALIITSLDSNAQKILTKYQFDIKDVKQDIYDEKANLEFIKMKSFQLIDRRISELESKINEMKLTTKTSLLKSRAAVNKNARLQGLKQLKLQIAEKYPQVNLAEIIKQVGEHYPKLYSGIYQHYTKDLLIRIVELEKYHLECCKRLKNKSYDLECKEKIEFKI